MTPELRETLGKAAHHAMSDFYRQRTLLNRSAMLQSDDFLWTKLDDDTKKLYQCEGEAVVNAYLTALGININAWNVGIEFREAMSKGHVPSATIEEIERLARGIMALAELPENEVRE